MDGWISFIDRRPEPQYDPECEGPSHPDILVTNNLEARNRWGQMSHLWLVSMVHYHDDGPHEFGGRVRAEKGEITAFGQSDTEIRGLTHWRPAVPEEWSVGPFPQEPAFGSPAAVEQAAETLRHCPMCRQNIPVDLALEHADACLGFNVGDGGAEERPPFQQIVLLEAERNRLRAEVERLREEVIERAAESARLQDETAKLSAAALAGAAGLVAASRERESLEQQRDALADALEALLVDQGGSSPVIGWIPIVWTEGAPGSGRQEAGGFVAAEQAREALRKAGR